jgi:hypothetical protein
MQIKTHLLVSISDAGMFQFLCNNLGYGNSRLVKINQKHATKSKSPTETSYTNAKQACLADGYPMQILFQMKAKTHGPCLTNFKNYADNTNTIFDSRSGLATVVDWPSNCQGKEKKEKKK